MKTRIALTIVACLFLVSCAVSTSHPTPTPLPTLTPTQTSTPEPTETPAPTITPTPTETPDPILARVPTGEPAESWKGIPIMPGAILGSERGINYIFTIRATVDEIQDYYQRELGKLGADNFVVGKGSEENSVMMLCFFFGDTVRIILVETIPYDDFILVILGE